MGQKMKRKNKILFHTLAILFFILGISGVILKNGGYEILICSKPALHILEIIFFIFAFLTESAFITVYSIKTGKYKYFLTFIVIVPVLFFFLLVLSARISICANTTVQRYNYKQFDKSIVVVNKSILLAGFSEIHETKNGFLIHKVTEIIGDDGLRPLEDDPELKITANRYGINYSYYYGNGTEKHCFIKYENGSFHEIKE